MRGPLRATHLVPTALLNFCQRFYCGRQKPDSGLTKWNGVCVNSASCDYERLYAAGGLYDGALAPSAPVGRWLLDVDAPYRYERLMPSMVLARTPERVSDLHAQYDAWKQEYATGPTSCAFELANAVLLDRTLYVPSGESWTVVYETDRPFERTFKTLRLPDADLNNVLKPRDASTSYFYLGTVGSENYAHWLVDDLTRARAIRDLRGYGRVTIVLDSYFDAIDRVRRESLATLFGGDEQIDVLFIDKKRPFFFERLFYVSPNSFHPFLKCATALRDLRDTLRVEIPQRRRLFIGRKGLWRNLLNEADVVAALAPLGFEYVVIDGMPFMEQVRLFSAAETIVGVAGASMGNTVFTPAGARLIYLAGEGFIDPFYWDLAAVMGHEYAVCFGEPWKPEKPTFSSFAVPEALLEGLVRAVGR